MVRWAALPGLGPKQSLSSPIGRDPKQPASSRRLGAGPTSRTTLLVMKIPAVSLRLVAVGTLLLLASGGPLLLFWSTTVAVPRRSANALVAAPVRRFGCGARGSRVATGLSSGGVGSGRGAVTVVGG